MFFQRQSNIKEVSFVRNDETIQYTRNTYKEKDPYESNRKMHVYWNSAFVIESQLEKIFFLFIFSYFYI